MTTYSKFENENGKLVIEYDDNVENPYESWDHGIKIYAVTRKYNIGENGGYSQLYTMLTDICYDLGIDYNDDTTEEQMISRIQKKVIFEPIYKYEHGSVALSVNSFNDRWDSGQIGFYLVDKNSLQVNFGHKNRTKKAIKEVEERAQSLLDHMEAHINGDVYAWFLYDEEYNMIDSCGGFYELDHMYEIIKESVNELDVNNEKKAQYLELVDKLERE